MEYDADHFELLDPQLLKKYTDPILQRLQVVVKSAATKRTVLVRTVGKGLWG